MDVKSGPSGKTNDTVKKRRKFKSGEKLIKQHGSKEKQNEQIIKDVQDKKDIV